MLSLNPNFSQTIVEEISFKSPKINPIYKITIFHTTANPSLYLPHPSSSRYYLKVNNYYAEILIHITQWYYFFGVLSIIQVKQ